VSDRADPVTRMSRIAHLDCIGGIAGDMLLAALLDAGASQPCLEAIPEQLGIGPVEIRVERVERQGIGALHVDVVPPDAPPPRTWRRMRELIGSADLPGRVRARALATFSRLAEAEAAVHGAPVDDVHFHELGGVDTLVDVCGAAALLDDLVIDRLTCSPLPLAHGTTRSGHGVLPLPAPATVELLRGAQITGEEGHKELVTPTGAALAVTLAESYGPPPALVLESVGYGAGSDDPPERPNLLRVLIGTAVPDAVREVVLLETNLDDLNPELVPDAVERCFTAGALDVWTSPVQMKKGRPGIVLSALARPAAERAVAATILEETSALGVRVSRLARYELEREERIVDVVGGTVRVKVGRLDGRVVNVAPEHDDCAAVARRSGRPVKAVWAEALSRAL
jgi:pyridinium-3,5-bisthiocarboxylic acid mononucleotide nickel chelatase